MSAPPPLGLRAVVLRRLSGVAFMIVLGLLVSLTVLIYNKTFVDVVHVSLQTNRIGNQLSPPADVKLRGLVVGEVRSVRSAGTGATVELALKPDKVDLIPVNVTAQLVPKTLFGEKYVLLVQPEAPSTEHLSEGDVISQDRTTTALETERVLDDLMPLLASLKPQQLSMTLNALSTALRERGDRLGRNLTNAGQYLAQFNPALPTLAQDMQGLADFTQNTADAAPALLEVLDNLSASSRSLVDQRDELDLFLATTRSFASSATSIVGENEKRLVALARDSLPSLNLYARYSSEFPCLLAGLAAYSPIVANTFGGLQPGLHITVEATEDNGGFSPGQEPKYRDSRPPYCNGLPDPARPAGDVSFDDGYRTSTTPTAKAAALLGPTAGQDSVLGQLHSRGSEAGGYEVPDIVTMLFGPLAESLALGSA